MAEYAIGSAGLLNRVANLFSNIIFIFIGVARAFSNYLDSLIDNRIQNFFQHHLPIHIPDLSPYPDFYSFRKNY